MTDDREGDSRREIDRARAQRRARAAAAPGFWGVSFGLFLYMLRVKGVKSAIGSARDDHDYEVLFPHAAAAPSSTQAPSAAPPTVS